MTGFVNFMIFYSAINSDARYSWGHERYVGKQNQILLLLFLCATLTATKTKTKNERRLICCPANLVQIFIHFTLIEIKMLTAVYIKHSCIA